MGRALPKRVVGWSGGLHAQESSTIIRILFSPKQSHKHHQLHWWSQETLISELKHQVCKAKQSKALKKRWSKTGPPPSSSWPEQKDFLLAQTPSPGSQKHTCSTVLWLKMRAPKCSRPEPNKPSQTHEHGLSKAKKVSFQISIFLSPAVLSFYCFLLCAVVPALAGQPGSTFTFAIWFAKIAEESYK